MSNNSVTFCPSKDNLIATFERDHLMSWTASKLSSLRIADNYLQSPYEEHIKYAERILNCCPQLSFRLRHVYRERMTYDPNAENIHDTVNFESGYYVEGNLENARNCRCRNCAVCIKSRVRKHRARLFQAFELMKGTYPDHKWLFVTLTTKQPPLVDTHQHLQLMNKAWDRLQRCKEFPGVGFVRTFEFTGPKQEGGGKWQSGPMHVHPHFHCLIMVPPSYFDSPRLYITQNRWRQLWQRSLKADYLPVVNVQKVTPNYKKGITSLQAAVLETVKYSVKPSSLAEAPPIWLAEITQQLHKTRTLTVGGVVADFVSQAELNRIDDQVKKDEVKQDGELVKFDWDGEAYRSVDVVNFGSVEMDCSEFIW